MQLTNAKGFTLIEIISVLIILGILAAIAVPKFFELQRTTESKTLLSVKSDLISVANMCFSKSILRNDGTADPTDCDDYAELGLSTTADVTSKYQNFVGTWTRTSSTVITYTYKSAGPTAAATFTLSPGTSTTPPMITFTGSV